MFKYNLGFRLEMREQRPVDVSFHPFLDGRVFVVIELLSPLLLVAELYDRDMIRIGPGSRSTPEDFAATRVAFFEDLEESWVFRPA